MTTPSKLLYRSLSIYKYYKYFFYRLAALTVAVIAFWLYYNNPVVTTILGVLALFVFLIIGEGELKVYSDKVRYSVCSILPIFSKPKTFFLRDIKSFDIDGSYDVDVDISSDFRSNNLMHGSDPYNHIKIVLKDGTVVNIETHIYINQLKNASGIITPLLDSTPYMGYIESDLK